MPTRLILIAHAATSSTRRAAFADGDGLDERGTSAARAMARLLPTPTRALTSPAPAARQTALALGMDRDLAVDDALRDIDLGTWAGRTIVDIDEAMAATWIGDPAFADHGGETLAAFAGRVAEWLGTRLGVRGLTIGVTHAAVVRACVLAALGAPLSAFWLVDVAPLTNVTLVSNGRRWALRGLRPPNDRVGTR